MNLLLKFNYYIKLTYEKYTFLNSLSFINLHTLWIMVNWHVASWNSEVCHIGAYFTEVLQIK